LLIIGITMVRLGNRHCHCILCR